MRIIARGICDYLWLLMKNSGREQSLPLLRLYCVNCLSVYDFHNSISDVTHPADLSHRIGNFQCLCDAFRLAQLFYPPREHFIRLMVYVGKVTVQFSAGEQHRISCPPMFLQVTPVALSSHADGLLFFFGQFQVREKIIPDLRISAAHLFKNCLCCCMILPLKIFI